jgi:hypothetical protein
MTKLPHFSEHANRGVLAADERARLRARLERAMDERPALAASPYFPNIAFGPFAFPARAAYAFAALLLIVAVSGSTAYAAESAVPGDLLYGVKTSVNEPVALALSVSAQSKAQTHAAIAEERLAEAQALASKGALTATTSARLADSFSANAADASDLIARIAPRDPASAAALHTAFSSAVATHASALLAQSDAAPATVRVASGNLVRNAIAATIGVAGYASSSEGSALAIAEAPAEKPVETASEATVSSGTIAVALSAAAPNETVSDDAVPAEAPHTFSAMMKAAPAAEPAPSPSAKMAVQSFAKVLRAPIEPDLSALIEAASTSFDAASSTLGADAAARAADALSDAKLIGLQVQADVAAGDDAAAREDRARGFAAVAKVNALLMASGEGR